MTHQLHAPNVLAGQVVGKQVYLETTMTRQLRSANHSLAACCSCARLASLFRKRDLLEKAQDS